MQVNEIRGNKPDFTVNQYLTMLRRNISGFIPCRPARLLTKVCQQFVELAQTGEFHDQTPLAITGFLDFNRTPKAFAQ